MRPHFLKLSKSRKQLFDILDVLILLEMLVFNSLILIYLFFFQDYFSGFLLMRKLNCCNCCNAFFE